MTLELQAEPRLNGPVVTTDRTMIARAISTLLDNALAYAPHPATVTVITGLSESAGEHRHVISVHNSGPGVSAAELPHLFERFYRGEAARDYKAPGAGLGLSIAQTIMQKLGGRLTVDSQPDQGVTFTLWLK